MLFHFTPKSENFKTGPIPVTMTSDDTCPKTCGLYRQCYAKGGNMAVHWRRLSNGFRRKDGSAYGLGLRELVARIKALPAGTLWRHNTAGDLPGSNTRINAKALASIVKANIGKLGFTYTHKPMTADNRKKVAVANKAGFTINLSADNPAQADKLKRLGIAPVVTVLPWDQRTNFRTGAGNLVVICPAITHKNVKCSTCKLCAWKDRDVIIGFPAHGVHWKQIQVAMPNPLKVLA